MTGLNESINDRNLFKAVFMAGGPGSGKSFMANGMFGFTGEEVFSYTGAQLVNSDSLFERFLSKNGLPMKMDKDGDQELYGKQQAVRNKAKDLTAKRQSNYIDGMLPIVIDGTGRDYDKITKQATELKKIGYDVSMVFVNTSLETALRRNQERPRSVDPQIVTDIWYQVQINIGKFQEFFGPENFIVIDSNTDRQLGTKETDEFLVKLFKIGNRLLQRPLKNPKGIKTLELLKATGGKYLSDLPEDMKEACRKHFGYVPWVMTHTID